MRKTNNYVPSLLFLVGVLMGCSLSSGDSNDDNPQRFIDCRDENLGCNAPLECIADADGVFSCQLSDASADAGIETAFDGAVDEVNSSGTMHGSGTETSTDTLTTSSTLSDSATETTTSMQTDSARETSTQTTVPSETNTETSTETPTDTETSTMTPTGIDTDVSTVTPTGTDIDTEMETGLDIATETQSGTETVTQIETQTDTSAATVTSTGTGTSLQTSMGVQTDTVTETMGGELDCRHVSLACATPYTCALNASGAYECLNLGNQVQDCRNVGRGCTLPFRCQQNRVGVYECLEDSSLNGTGSSETSTNTDTEVSIDTVSNTNIATDIDLTDTATPTDTTILTSNSDTQTTTSSHIGTHTDTAIGTDTAADTTTQTGTATVNTTQTALASATATETQTAVGTVTATQTAASATASETATQTAAGTATATDTQTAASTTASETVTQTATATATATATQTATATATATQTAAGTATATDTQTAASITASETVTQTATATVTETQTATATATETQTATATETVTQTASATATATATQTATATATETQTATGTETVTQTASATATATATQTATATATQTATATATATQTATATATATQTATATETVTQTASATATATATQTATGTETAAQTDTATDSDGDLNDVFCEKDEDCEASQECIVGICQLVDICGDGVPSGFEDCDDGGESAQCNSDCTFALCGDSNLNVTAGEECDDGNTLTESCAYGEESCEVCASDCSLTTVSGRFCGDGTHDPEEACDEGAQNGDGACSTECALTTCGDGIVDAGEECDDDGESAACSALCLFTDNFVSVWQMPDTDQTLTLPLREVDATGKPFSYDFTVDWGDGSTSRITEFDDPETSHDYSAPGTYTVVISGTMETFSMQLGTDNEKLIAVPNLGAVGWTSLEGAFFECTNLTIFRGGDTSDVTDMHDMFALATQVMPEVGHWDTSKVENMNALFSSATNADPDVSQWNTSKVRIMSNMFNYAVKANPDVSQWDTSSVITMAWMFMGTSIANPDVSTWDTGNVREFNSMFSGALEAVPNVTNWNMSNAEDVRYMFSAARHANPNVANWDVRNVTSTDAMFSGAVNANPDLSQWELPNVISMEGMLNNSALSIENYTDFLQSLRDQGGLARNVSLSVGPEYLGIAQPARDFLTQQLGWFIQDGGAIHTCGDGVVGGGETCDDNNQETESCPYGDEQCDVCANNCQLVQGDASYCGDNQVDAAFGEECDDGNTVTEQCQPSDPNCEVCGPNCTFRPGINPTDPCFNSVRDNGEDGIDCGGSCRACDDAPCTKDTECAGICSFGQCFACDVDSECTEGNHPTFGITDGHPDNVHGEGFACQQGRCVEAGDLPNCEDGVLNGNETDIDCGGFECNPLGKTCANGSSCNQKQDCASGFCNNGQCADEITCEDQIQNQGETDVDCGGENCDPCAVGRSCQETTDCAVGDCLDGTCFDVADYCRVDTPLGVVTTPGDSVLVYGVVEEEGATGAGTDPDGNLWVQLGHGDARTHPRTHGSWTWSDADHDAVWVGVGEDAQRARYSGTLAVNSIGAYDYAFRVSTDGGASWRYCDVDGTGDLGGFTDTYELHNAAGLRTLNPSITPVTPRFDDMNGDEIIIDEVMLNPVPFRASGDAKWFEIRNLTDEHYDLTNTVISSLGRTRVITYPVILAPGAYITFGTALDTAVNGAVDHEYAWGIDSGFSINTGSLFISLMGTDSNDFATVFWEPGQDHPAGAAAQWGSGVEPALDSDGTLNVSIYSDTNWCSATSLYGNGENAGTPGAPNTQCAVDGNQTAPIMTTLNAYYNVSSLGFGVEIFGTDAEDNMVAFTLELLDEQGTDVLNPGLEPVIIQFSAGARPTNGTAGYFSYNIDELFEDYGTDLGYSPLWTQVRARLVDTTGLQSDPFVAAPMQPPLTDLGEACDPYGALSLCDENTYCGAPDADTNLVCTAPATYCPVGMEALDEAVNGDGWQLSGTTAGTPTDYEGTCGGGEGRVVYSFTGQQAEVVLFKVSATQPNGLNPPAIYLQKACDLIESELACDADAGSTAMVSSYVDQDETIFVVVDGSADPTEGVSVQGAYTITAEVHQPPFVASAQGFINEAVNLVSVAYIATVGSLDVAGAEFEFKDVDGVPITMNGVPGPFAVGDTPVEGEGVAYLPINFTAAERAAIATVEFFVTDALDNLSAPIDLELQTPPTIQSGGGCDPQQGINVCVSPLSCLGGQGSATPTCQ